jgi:cell division protein FtsZ
MNNKNPQELEVFGSSNDSLKERFKIDKKPLHIIALGGAGCNFLRFIYNHGVNAKYTAVSSESGNIPKDSTIEFIHFAPPQKEVMIDRGTFVDKLVSIDMNNRLQMPDAIYKHLESDDKFIIISGLGGYISSFFTEDTANYLSKNGKTFLIICTLPFSFEGERTRYAEDTRKKLSSFDNFKYIENNSLKEKYGNVGFKASFQKIDELFLDIVNDYIAE